MKKLHGLMTVLYLVIALFWFVGCAEDISPTEVPLEPKPPNDPTNLTATPKSTTCIELGWEDNSTDEQGFKIERMVTGGSWEVVQSVEEGVTAYSDTGLTVSTEYHYQAYAFNGEVASGSSNEVSATPLLLAPMNLTAKAKSVSSIELDWEDQSTDELGFIVEREMGSGAWGEVKVVPVDSHAYTDAGLTDQTLYSYRVCAYGENNLMSDYSSIQSATTPKQPSAGDTETQIISGVAFSFAWIPPGSFQMGSVNHEQDRDRDEGPLHTVTFASGFWMMTTEVTQMQWQAVTDSNPSYRKGDNLPVECVSWNDIQLFEDKLNSSDSGKGYCLPSEAEWEYACRAGTRTRFYWGNDPNYGEVGNFAWYCSNSGNSTHPVGKKRQNAWGLYDMSGNVWEWCEDSYHSSYNGAPEDGRAWIVPENFEHYDHVARGGSWGSNPEWCRSAQRVRVNSDFKMGHFGFRLVSR